MRFFVRPSGKSRSFASSLNESRNRRIYIRSDPVNLFSLRAYDSGRMNCRILFFFLRPSDWSLFLRRYVRYQRTFQYFSFVVVNSISPFCLLPSSSPRWSCFLRYLFGLVSWLEALNSSLISVSSPDEY